MNPLTDDKWSALKPYTCATLNGLGMLLVYIYICTYVTMIIKEIVVMNVRERERELSVGGNKRSWKWG